MSVDTTSRSTTFILDGIITEFDFSFRALPLYPEDIKCIVTSNGTDTILDYTDDYTATINANGVGGIVTLVDAVATGLGDLTVYRETENKQQSDYDDYNQFPANTLEEDIDRRTLISQEMAEQLTRSLFFPITSGMDGGLPAPTAGCLVGVNPTNDGMALYENPLYSSIGSVVQSHTAFYLGPTDVNGSWRIIRDGNNLSIQRREGGSWVEKGAFLP